MGINAIIGYKKVNEMVPTRSRHVSRSGSFDFNSPFFIIVYVSVQLTWTAPSSLTLRRTERATWHSLIRSLKRFCGELIAADSSFSSFVFSSRPLLFCLPPL